MDHDITLPITLPVEAWRDVAAFLDAAPLAGVDPAGVEALCMELVRHNLFAAA